MPRPEMSQHPKTRSRLTVVLRWILGSFLVLVAVAYLSAAAFLYSRQDDMLYPGAQHQVSADPLGPATDAEVIWLTTSFGRTESWIWSPSRPVVTGTSPAVIFAHGNGEVIDQWIHGLDRFRDLGFALMLVEYPGYGRSDGTPSEESITETMVEAFDALASRPDVDPQRVVAYGQSLGGAAVCALSRHRPLAALVLQSTFTSTRPFAKRFFMPPFLVRDTFDNLAAVRAYSGPVLLIHGRFDELIPHQHAVELADAAPRATLISYDCGHWCWYPDTLPFWTDVTEFLERNAVIAPSSD